MSAGADAFKIGAELIAAGVAVAAAAQSVTKHYAALVELQVKANASGRPGPRAPSGQYRGSINTEFRFGGDALIASIGTNAPQGRRLEYGFVGRDSLGRNYAQPPFPHFGPAIDKFETPYVDAIARAIHI